MGANAAETEPYATGTHEVPVISRAQFLADWKYGDGQHLTMLGPTQRGKTTLGLQLLDKSISENRQVVILAGKPPERDIGMSAAAEKLNLRVIESWPPYPSIMDRAKHRRGYVLRPKQTLEDLDADADNVRTNFRKGIMSNYALNKPRITFVDEAHHVQNDLKLKKELEAPLMRGAPHNAVWGLIQRGRYMSYLFYDAPEHTFLFFDPDLSNQRRYSEIGGVDPKFLMALSQTLRTYEVNNGRTTISECIYIRRSGPQICIVDVT